MKAFLVYSQAPAADVPPGMPLGLPWRERDVTEEQAATLRAQGWQVLAEADYDAYVASLEDQRAAYEIAATQFAIEGVVTAATRFGQALLVSFAAENVLLGITYEGKTGEVLDKLQGILTAVQSGSLHEVIARARAIPEASYDSKYITAARLLAFVNKTEDYLGIPRSTSL